MPTTHCAVVALGLLAALGQLTIVPLVILDDYRAAARRTGRHAAARRPRGPFHES